jgi:hypothetical protein
MLADSVFSVCAADPDEPAAIVVNKFHKLPEQLAMMLAKPWLAARSPVSAVRELLAYGASTSSDERLIAIAVARSVGPTAAEGWREWARMPGFGVYARAWLTEQGEVVTADPRDEAWMTVDAMSAQSATMPDEAVPLAIQMGMQQASVDPAEMVDLVSRSGHPDAGWLLEAINAPPENNTPTDVYQLKITLREVSEPSVWRRVTVPAETRLDSLHYMIQDAMGWEGGHAHMFTVGRRMYGDPAAELSDEGKVTLRDLLSRRGSKLLYTYDFGDDWEHDVVFEERDHGAGAPRCLEGEGMCPPDDCGGASGYAQLKEILADPGDEEHEDMLEWMGLDSGADFNPKDFSVDEVNMRLGNPFGG